MTQQEKKVAIITGASSGIGEAAASMLLTAGYRVAILARRMDRLQAQAEQAKLHNNEVLPLVCDVSNEQAVGDAVKIVVQTWGRLDVIVTCAGIMQFAPLADPDTADWRTMIDVNLLGTLYTVRHALPHLQATKGHVVTLSSVTADHLVANSGVYSATKSAIETLTESLRQEVTKSGVRTTLIKPGIVQTDFASMIHHDQARRGIEQALNAMQALSPADVADAIRYAISTPPHVSINQIILRPTAEVMP